MSSRAPLFRPIAPSESGLAADALAAPLLELELAGRVVCDRDGRLRVVHGNSLGRGHPY